ncbi:hypothetical protein Q5P01_005961 [Channa striata]|uniref:Immunoglobulin domain-containing protein n=1 Tax=Channa striata TaxID=64152 RepID=A0AA88NH53_CHASR|nr:hypothetical protein Q5P01_005961 [Channa striata]
MDLLWMILLLFLVCAQAQNITEVREKLGQNITEVRVELGQNVTLKCSGDNSNTYWYMEIYHSQVQGFIGRSFSNDPSDSQYQVRTVRPKYSAFGNSLMIINITADDCRLYFCGRKINNSVHFVDTFRLVSDVPTPPPTDAHKATDGSVSLNELIRNGSLALNVLLLVIIGLICLLKTKEETRTCGCHVTEPQPPYDSPDAEGLRQYEEIQLPPYRPPAGPSECIYYQAQLPRPTHPRR